MLNFEAPSINKATRPGIEVKAMSGCRSPSSDGAAIAWLIPKSRRAAPTSSRTCTHIHTTSVQGVA